MVSLPRPTGSSALMQGGQYIYGSPAVAALIMGGDLQRLTEAAAAAAASKGELQKRWVAQLVALRSYTVVVAFRDLCESHPGLFSSMLDDAASHAGCATWRRGWMRKRGGSWGCRGQAHQLF